MSLSLLGVGPTTFYLAGGHVGLVLPLVEQIVEDFDLLRLLV